MPPLRLPAVAACLAALTVATSATSGCARPAAEEPVAPLELVPCKVPGLQEEARCGSYPVFEDREARTGRTIELKVVVLPATGAEPARSAVTFLAGGPGGAATEAAAGLVSIMGPLRASRDLLLVDARGTGESHSLRCAYQDERLGYLEAFLPLDGVRECWQELSGKADLSLYTTSLAMDDLDQVRRALGYEQLDLIAGSYGTRAALDYMRRHPEAVHTAFLEGPDPTNSRSPVTFAADAQAALDGWIEECREDPACAAAFPDFRTEVPAVLERLAASPVEVEVLNPKSGERETVRLTKDAASQTLRYMLYSTGTAVQVPLVVHRAAEGDFEGLGQTTLSFAGLVDSLSDGFFLSVTCAEDVPFFTLEEAREAAAGTFLGDYRARQQKEACAAWPVPQVDESFLEPVRSDVPTLVVVGERDPVTPPRWGHQVGHTLSNAQVLVVPDGGHGYSGMEGTDCVDEAAVQLISSSSLEGLDLESCRDGMVRPDFLLEVPDEEAIELPPETLERYAGTYRSADPPFEGTVSLEKGSLVALFPPRAPLHLVPVSEVRFQVVGAPPGVYLVFQLQGEEVVGLTVEQGSLGRPLDLERLPD